MKETQELKSKRKNGYILVEAAVATTIILVGLLGIFALLSRSLSLNRVVSDRYVATYLAAEGIELVKNIIDNNLVQSQPFNAGLSSGSFEMEFDDLSLGANLNRQLNFDAGSGHYSYGGGRPTPFKRSINIELVGGGDEIKVNSLVEWTSRGDARFEVNLEDHFFNWR